MDSEATSVPSVPDQLPLLTNHSRFDADTLQIAFRRTNRRWFVAFLVLGILFFHLGLYQALHDFLRYRFELRLLLFPLVAFAGAAYYFWKAFTSVNKAVKRSIQRLEETRQVSGFDNAYYFMETEILDAPDISADMTHVSYSVVKRLVPIQHLILVYTQAKQFFILDRTRFENGTEADFWKLMSEKCPRAVPKKYRA